VEKYLMDETEKIRLLKFREEYEESRMKMADFARSKGIEYWKTRYALRKALLYREENQTAINKRVIFKKVQVKKESTLRHEVRIKTSYGAEIIIPI
jgi:hypothetical protein